MSSLAQFREQSRRRNLTGVAFALVITGILAIVFAAVVSIKLPDTPGLEGEDFATIASAIGFGAMPYAIFGSVLIAAGVVVLAALTGPRRAQDTADGDRARGPAPTGGTSS